MSGITTEARLDRMAADLIGVIQALGLMSQMQRQQGEQLGQVIALLTPEPSRPGPDLSELLSQLVATTSQVGAQVASIGTALGQVTDRLPGQLGRAIDEALARAVPGPRG
ncbi:MAG: hypothetical protein ACRYG8_29100 [Janthinobacterium lividum]